MIDTILLITILVSLIFICIFTYIIQSQIYHLYTKHIKDENILKELKEIKKLLAEKQKQDELNSDKK